MSRRRITSKQASEIGKRRIAVLTGLAEEAVKEGRSSRAKRYMELARRIGMKTRTEIPKEFRYCGDCLMPLIPEVSCRVRLNRGRVSITCFECGAVKRFPYLREQKDDRERCQKRVDEAGD